MIGWHVVYFYLSDTYLPIYNNIEFMILLFSQLNIIVIPSIIWRWYANSFTRKMKTFTETYFQAITFHAIGWMFDDC